jgi:hypothetical protein
MKRTVTAVFQCTKKQETGGGNATELVFNPPYQIDTMKGQPHDPATQTDRYKRVNESWSPYTPCGQLSMQVNGPAAESFEQGEYYLLTFEKFEG